MSFENVPEAAASHTYFIVCRLGILSHPIPHRLSPLKGVGSRFFSQGEGMSVKYVGSVESNHNSDSTGKLAVGKMALLKEEPIGVRTDDVNRLYWYLYSYAFT